MDVSAGRIELRIDSLVLHGVDPRARYRVADAFSAELTRLLTERGVPAALASAGEKPAIDAGEMRLGGGSDRSTGVDLANAVYRGMSR